MFQVRVFSSCFMSSTLPSSCCPSGRSDSAECTGQNNSHPVVIVVTARPILSFDTLCSLFSCWRTVKGHAGRHVRKKKKKGQRGFLRKKHLFQLTQSQRKEVTPHSASRGPTISEKTVCLFIHFSVSFLFGFNLSCMQALNLALFTLTAKWAAMIRSLPPTGEISRWHNLFGLIQHYVY